MDLKISKGKKTIFNSSLDIISNKLLAGKRMTIKRNANPKLVQDQLRTQQSLFVDMQLKVKCAEILHANADILLHLNIQLHSNLFNLKTLNREEFRFNLKAIIGTMRKDFLILQFNQWGCKTFQDKHGLIEEPNPRRMISIEMLARRQKKTLGLRFNLIKQSDFVKQILLIKFCNISEIISMKKLNNKGLDLCISMMVTKL